MVVFVDLETDDDDSSYTNTEHLISNRIQAQAVQAAYSSRALSAISSGAGEPELSRNSFSAALSCYPIALSLSSHLDLNDLHSLSLTCRRIHDPLTQFAHQLVTHSLRCTYDAQPLRSEVLAVQLAQVASHQNVDPPSTVGGSLTFPTASVTHSDEPFPDLGNCRKICACARDLVAGCRRCGKIVCRNCVAKPPGRYYAKDRYRRLCQKCIDAPLAQHLHHFISGQDNCETPPRSSASSTRSARSVSDSSATSINQDESEEQPIIPSSFTSEAFLRGSCNCANNGVFLCYPCGHNLRANDVTYRRVWTWRSRYSTHIGGGLGTGLGTGNQGQKCGRGDHCLETGTIGISWVEIDCSENQGHENSQDLDGMSGSRAATPVGEAMTAGPINSRPGYMRQEIEGIGGVVKKKVKKKVRVGGTVWEYEDERMTGKYLEREANGKQRSWCGWCHRVCLGEQDRQAHTPWVR